MLRSFGVVNSCFPKSPAGIRPKVAVNSKTRVVNWRANKAPRAHDGDHQFPIMVNTSSRPQSKAALDKPVTVNNNDSFCPYVLFYLTVTEMGYKRKTSRGSYGEEALRLALVALAEGILLKAASRQYSTAPQ